MGKALYRVYRSKSFNELVGQDHITKNLQNAIKNGHVNHAYLFTGPRGVGKTSVARILAHSLNGLDYNNETNHVDIIEIDAASNRRIDEIRDLREKVHIAPTQAKYKIYIIDEVHMLTKEAFNALLKTLEEPPKHVVFILATTEFYKLPETIISRCLRFTFRPIEQSDIVEHLKNISKIEKIEIDNEALDLIAEHSGGSFRDSISLLEQARSISGTKIDASKIESILGLAPKDIIDEILAAVARGDSKSLISVLEKAYAHGANEMMIAKQLAKRIRNSLLDKDGILPTEDSIMILEEIINLGSSADPHAQLELILLKPSLSMSKTPEKQSQPKSNIPDHKPSKEITPKNRIDPKPESTKPNTNIGPWEETLNELKKRNNTLYSIARMAKPEVDDETILLRFKFVFHFKQINEQKNKALISDIISSINPDIKTVKPIHDPQAEENTVNKPVNNAIANSITNIFGEAEVLES